jgi:hypothetical protein
MMKDSKKNTGSENSGNWNSGNRNSGNRNSGNRNSGNWNSGDWNSGNWNSGDRNSGNWNSGNRNSGFFNTDEPNIRMFNKDTGMKRDDVSLPYWIFFDPNAWVDESEMTDKEKIDNPTYKTTGGYLKEVDYKEAWAKAWEGTTKEERKQLFDLPNFDAEIFKEISGIDVTQDDKPVRKMTVAEVCEAMGCEVEIVKGTV